MPRFARLALVVAVLGAVTIAGAAASSTVLARSDKPTASAFRAEMRKLWEDHITWTRLYIVSAATLDTDLPDIGPTAERLFQNQADIGAAVGAFYGAEAGDALTALLNDHIALAAEAITKAKAGDQAGLQDALNRWYANADDIARFLADANPQSWPFEMMSAHMRDHLDLTLQEAVARLDGDYAGDIAAYDRVHVQILQMADMLSDGIIAAFPGSFNGSGR
ncbi:MAG TPA: hypothetical protein VFW95_03190 [Candidatus Limnocylindria bacterium]|nr:hypothetical protein [Candidatus Limnocylindria bacterium]